MLVDRLLAEGHTVDVIDDLSSGSLANLAEARSRPDHDLTFHHLDVRAPELESLFARRRPDVVFHLTATGSVTARGAVEEIVVSGAAVLDAATATGVGKVVVGLAAIDLYGPVTSRELPVKESTPWHSSSPRGVATRCLVDQAAGMRERRGLEFTALAIAELYGPRSSAGLVAELRRAIAARERIVEVEGGGRRTIDLVWVDDVVDAFVRAGHRGSGLVMNLGTGVQTTVRELYERLGGTGVLTAASGLGDDAPARFALSCVRARIHLGWSPWTSVAEGLASLEG